MRCVRDPLVRLMPGLLALSALDVRLSEAVESDISVMVRASAGP